MSWQGVLPAITTPFTDASGETVDHAFLREHLPWMLEQGCKGTVALGSLGEASTLSMDEKLEVLATCVQVAGDAPVVAGITALSTRDGVALARGAAERGCRGLMILPPWVHKGPIEEVRDHIQAIVQATDLDCMLYNNPIAYGTDLAPELIMELASACPNVMAVKESSGDVRRLTAVRALAGDRLSTFAGLDDMAFEAGMTGAEGWVAGLVNAFPAESVRVFELAQAGKREEAMALYAWFLPLLRLDCIGEFVQAIKLVQARVDRGQEHVRLPRKPLFGALREHATKIIDDALTARP